MEKKKLKRYKIVVNPDNLEDGFMDRISIVNNPAIERKGLYFHKEYKFKENKEKMEIIAPFLVPDLPILRKDENGEYFEVVFEKETIELLIEKFQKTGDNKRINYNHEDVMVNGYIKEIWIKESQNDKSTDYGFDDVPVGSAFMIVKIDDKDFWENEVKKMGFYGYSIELLADLELMEFFVASGSTDSSNVNQYRYDSETEILFITFNDGSTYKYYNVAFGEFMDIRDGNAQCISEGSNQYGSWFVGKTPSVGAAVYVYLVAAGKRFERSAFNSINEVLDFMTDDEIKESLESFVIEPIAGETEDEFIGRCMAIETNSYPNDQAYAICISKWEKK